MPLQTQYELDVSTHNDLNGGSASVTAYQHVTDRHTPPPRALPFGVVSIVDVLFLEAYVSELERKLRRQEKRREEIITRYESVLDEQRRMYQMWIHELESQGCTCDTAENVRYHHQNRKKSLSSLVNKLWER